MTTAFTIGHSTRSFEDFVALLADAQIQVLADVRRFPSSRRHPQFNGPALAEALAPRGIGYRHFEALGGRRAPASASRNLLWKEAAFRGYADYAATPTFRAALDGLAALARAQTCAVMCAEALWWQCHRRIVADYLLADGFSVCHILGAGKIEPAQLTPGAQLAGDGVVLYPAPPGTHTGDLFDASGARESR
jgi:uncharacterized protein (DUF488 family)